MKFATQTRPKFTYGWAIGLTGCAALMCALAILSIWTPLPSRQIHPDFAAAMPGWVIWLREYEAEYLRTLFVVTAASISALAGQAWGDQSR